MASSRARRSRCSRSCAGRTVSRGCSSSVVFKRYLPFGDLVDEEAASLGQRVERRLAVAPVVGEAGGTERADTSAPTKSS